MVSRLVSHPLRHLEADVPPAVVIDEAVDIAKHFSGEDAGRFVNGVLEARPARARRPS